MNTSNAATLKSPIAMPSTGKASDTASSWLARVGRVVMAAIIKSGESRARAALGNHYYY